MLSSATAAWHETKTTTTKKFSSRAKLFFTNCVYYFCYLPREKHLLVNSTLPFLFLPLSSISSYSVLFQSPDNLLSRSLFSIYFTPSSKCAPSSSLPTHIHTHTETHTHYPNSYEHSLVEKDDNPCRNMSTRGM